MRHLPFNACPGEELMLLHRHWMWANQQREAFGALLGKEDGRSSRPACATSDTLRRNAVLHVPEKSELLDKRIEQLMTVPDSPTTIGRIHRGFGRLLIEEFRRRSAENEARAALADSPPEG